MKFLKFLYWIPIACMYLCAATTVAQAIGLGAVWTQDALTTDKITRYVAVLYGFDLRDLANEVSESASDEGPGGEGSRPASLAERVAAHPVVTDRVSAVKGETVGMADWVQNLKRTRERHEFVKASFEDLLDELERDASTTSLQEVQRTLTVLQPRQSKDLILRMLEDEDLDAEDDVLGDVVAIVQSMPQDKLKKILGEFKSIAERETLHRIMMEIGEINRRQPGELKS